MGEEEKDFGAEEAEEFGAIQSSEPWSRWQILVTNFINLKDFDLVPFLWGERNIADYFFFPPYLLAGCSS